MFYLKVEREKSLIDDATPFCRKQKKAHIDADAFDMFIQFWCDESNWIYLMPLNAMLNKL